MTSPLGWVSILPIRVVDTRQSRVLAPDSCIAVDVGEAFDHEADLTGALLDVTLSDAVESGFVTAYPCGSQRPISSMLSVAKAAQASASVVVATGSADRVCLYSSGGGSVVVDLLGAFTANGAGIESTRAELDLFDTDLSAGAGLAVTLPSSVASATGIVIDLKVDSLLPGYISNCAAPEVSVIDFPAGSTGRQIIVPARAGEICLTSSVAAHVAGSTSIWFDEDADRRIHAVERRHDGRESGTGGIQWTTDATYDMVIFGTITLVTSQALPSMVDLDPGCTGASDTLALTAETAVSSTLVALVVASDAPACLTPVGAGYSIFDYQASS